MFWHLYSSLREKMSESSVIPRQQCVCGINEFEARIEVNSSLHLLTVCENNQINDNTEDYAQSTLRKYSASK